MKIFSRLFITANIIVGIYSCTDTNTSFSVANVYQFDSTKLSKPINDYACAVQFFTPENWLELNSELSDKIISAKRSKIDEQGFIYTPARSFLNKSTNSTLFVGKLRNEKYKSDSDLFKKNYRNLLLQNYGSDVSSSRNLRLSNTDAIEFLIKKENLISYKLFFLNSRSEFIQFDYSTTINHYQHEKPAIESSIASIKM